MSTSSSTELLVGDRWPSSFLGELDDGAGIFLDAAGELQIEAVLVVYPALGVADRHHLGSEELPAEEGGMAPGVPVSLDGDRCPREVDPQLLSRLADGEHAAPGRGVVAAAGAAYAEGLSGDAAELVLPRDLRVLVHHPGHDLGGGVDVGGGDVLIGAYELPDSVDVPPAEPLQLILGELLGVADDAALPPAEGEVEEGALPGHPGGEGPDGVDSLIGVEPDPPLRRPLCVVVLDPEPLGRPWCVPSSIRTGMAT